MPPTNVALFSMPDRGHFQRLRSLITGLASLGAVPHVLTDRRFEPEIAGAGGVFVDLFADGGVDDADDESWPFPVRFTTFAARHLDRVLRDLDAMNCRLVVSDTFAVIGSAAARLRGVPHVNVCAGHAVVPARFLPLVREHPRVRVSARCDEAVAVLKSRGVDAASPFGYVTGFSRDLNLYCEPEAFLDPADRAVFEPLAFYGSLQSRDEWAPAGTESPFGSKRGTTFNIYVSFGTMIWSYRQSEALAALGSIAEAFGRRPDIRAVISLGGTGIDPGALAALERPNVRVERYVDQWRALRDADLFVTHHGLNSTHEAIIEGVPMISYPFVWDQPGLAAACARLGLAVPLVPTAMGAVSVADVDAALAAVERTRAAMDDALARARQWELDVMAGRPALLQRMLDLAR
jgi:UDP:flavonoid glycosyltransferase YjiC (YdhE family)